MNLNLKLKGKLVLYILAAFTIIYGVTLGFISRDLRQNSIEDSKEIVKSNLLESRNILVGDLTKVYETVNVLRNTYERYERFDAGSRNEMYNDMLVTTLENNSDYLTAWMCWELKALVPGYSYKNGRTRHIYYRLNNQIQNQLDTADVNNDNLETLYYQARDLNKDDIWNPYYDEAAVGLSDVLMTTISCPIQNNGEFVGIAAVDISLATMQEIILRINPFEGATSYLLAANKKVVAHTNRDLIFANMEEELSQESDLFNTAFDQVMNRQLADYDYYNEVDGEDHYVFMAPVEIKGMDRIWTIGIDVPESVFLAKADQIFHRSLIIGILGLILLYVLVFLVATRIVKPINMSVDFAHQIAEGNLDATIDLKSKDEMGELARSLQEMVSNLKRIILDVIRSSKEINQSGNELSASSNELSTGAANQAASSEEISSSMEEMVATIQQNNHNAQQTAAISQRAAKGIKEGFESAKVAVNAMNEIAEKIVIIKDIAAQTNILALNAAVEAARAGEHGRGFSVVATEVKKLAERSQKAAIEIIELTQHGVEISNLSGEQLERIIPDIEKTAMLVQEITASSLEQQTGAEQVNRAIQELNEVTQRNSEASHHFTNSAERLTALSDKLREVVSFFKYK